MDARQVQGTATLQLGQFATEYTITALASELVPLISAAIADELKRHITASLQPIRDDIRALAMQARPAAGGAGGEVGAGGDGRSIVFICDPTVSAPTYESVGPAPTPAARQVPEDQAPQPRWATPAPTEPERGPESAAAAEPPSAHRATLSAAPPAPASQRIPPPPATDARPASSADRAATDAAASPRMPSDRPIPVMRVPTPRERPLPGPPRAADLGPEVQPLGELATCSVCGRQFAAARLARHEAICAKSHAKKKPADSEERGASLSGAKDVENERATPSPPPARPRPAASALGGPRGGDMERVPCPHCGRKFGPEAAERHIPICERNADKARIRELTKEASFAPPERPGAHGAARGKRRPTSLAGAQQPRRAQSAGRQRLSSTTSNVPGQFDASASSMASSTSGTHHHRMRASMGGGASALRPHHAEYE